MAARIVAACGGSVRGRTIAIFGLTFKPETDDMRDAPAIPIVSRLVEDGATVRAFDPEGMEQARPLFLRVPSTVRMRWMRRRGGCAGHSDRVERISRARPERLRETMRGRIVVDLRNIYDPAAMRAGFHTRGSAARAGDCGRTLLATNWRQRRRTSEIHADRCFRDGNRASISPEISILSPPSQSRPEGGSSSSPITAAAMRRRTSCNPTCVACRSSSCMSPSRARTRR